MGRWSRFSSRWHPAAARAHLLELAREMPIRAWPTNGQVCSHTQNTRFGKAPGGHRGGQVAD